MISPPSPPRPLLPSLPSPPPPPSYYCHYSPNRPPTYLFFLHSSLPSSFPFMHFLPFLRLSLILHYPSFTLLFYITLFSLFLPFLHSILQSSRFPPTYLPTHSLPYLHGPPPSTCPRSTPPPSQSQDIREHSFWHSGRKKIQRASVITKHY